MDHFNRQKCCGDAASRRLYRGGCRLTVAARLRAQTATFCSVLCSFLLFRRMPSLSALVGVLPFERVIGTERPSDFYVINYDIPWAA